MKKNVLLKIAVLSIFFVQMGIGTITPAIANIGAAFPEVPFTTLLLVSTLAVIMSVPATIISGRLAGNVVSYKTLLVIGMILFLGGGIGPYYMNSSFEIILVLRAIFGIGLGIVTPLGAALIIAFFDGEARASMMGLSSVVANIGGILFQLLGGMAATITWNLSFAIHGLGIITLLLVFLLPEPEKAPTQEIGEAAPKMPMLVYGYAILIIALMAIVYPVLTNMSTVIQVFEMGTAASAALVLTMFTVGGMISGTIFAKMFGIFKQKVIAISLVLAAIAMGSVSFGTSIIFMYIATTLAGIGFGMVVPTIFMTVGMNVSPAQVPIASGMIMAALNIGGFLSAYFYAAISAIFSQTGNLKFPFTVGMILFAIGAVCYLLYKPNEKKVQLVNAND